MSRLNKYLSLTRLDPDSTNRSISEMWSAITDTKGDEDREIAFKQTSETEQKLRTMLAN